MPTTFMYANSKNNIITQIIEILTDFKGLKNAQL